MLKGIDVSSHNGWPFSSDTQDYYKQSDFVIIKATQGLSYLYQHYKSIAEQALRDGKLIGFYHYAGGNDAAREAEYFYNAISDYSGRAIPCLDFENYQNSSYNDYNWCRKFVDRYHELSNVWPLIYTGMYARDRCKNCADVCGLWLAGYPRIGYKSFEPPRFIYEISPWNTYTIWQYTDGGGACDLNTAALTREGWGAIASAGGKVSETKPSTSAPTGSTYALARKVIDGEFGNGAYRQQALGSRYAEIQTAVNTLIGGSDSQLARLVIAGAMGSGNDRKYILGSRYQKVQNLVNKMLS